MRPYYVVETDVVEVLQRDLPLRVQVQLWRVTEREESSIGRTRSEVTREVVTSWSLVPTDQGVRPRWVVYSWRDGVVRWVEGSLEATARAEAARVDEPGDRHEAMPLDEAQRLVIAYTHGRVLGAQRGTDLAERYAEALKTISSHLCEGSAGSIMRARAVIAGLGDAQAAEEVGGDDD